VENQKMGIGIYRVLVEGVAAVVEALQVAVAARIMTGVVTTTAAVAIFPILMTTMTRIRMIILAIPRLGLELHPHLLLMLVIWEVGIVE